MLFWRPYCISFSFYFWKIVVFILTMFLWSIASFSWEEYCIILCHWLRYPSYAERFSSLFFLFHPRQTELPLFNHFLLLLVGYLVHTHLFFDVSSELQIEFGKVKPLMTSSWMVELEKLLVRYPTYEFNFFSLKNLCLVALEQLGDSPEEYRVLVKFPAYHRMKFHQFCSLILSFSYIDYVYKNVC